MTKSKKRKAHDKKVQAKQQEKFDVKISKEEEEYLRPFDGKPKNISMIVVAFPARVVGNIMPKPEDIPEEFRKGRTKWHQFQRDWFFKGVKDLKMIPKEGIDPVLIQRNLQAINSSFEPKHQDKEAGFAYVCSLWLEDVTYTVASP